MCIEDLIIQYTCTLHYTILGVNTMQLRVKQAVFSVLCSYWILLNVEMDMLSKEKSVTAAHKW